MRPADQVDQSVPPRLSDGPIKLMGTPDQGWAESEMTSTAPVTRTSWPFAATSRAPRTSLTGLPSGSKIWVRVRALGP